MEIDLPEFGTNMATGLPVDITQVEPALPEIDRGRSAELAMRIVYGMLTRDRRIRQARISPHPVETPTAYEMTLVSPLIDERRNKIGTIRVFVLVPKHGENIQIRIEWTRNAFGFWFQEKVVLKKSVENPSMALLAPLRAAMILVRQTVTGSVKLKSMIRMIRKVKKHRGKDAILQYGLVGVQ